jgi:hypothetical protein
MKTRQRRAEHPGIEIVEQQMEATEHSPHLEGLGRRPHRWIADRSGNILDYPPHPAIAINRTTRPVSCRYEAWEPLIARAVPPAFAKMGRYRPDVFRDTDRIGKDIGIDALQNERDMAGAGDQEGVIDPAGAKWFDSLQTGRCRQKRIADDTMAAIQDRRGHDTMQLTTADRIMPAVTPPAG